MTHYTRRRAIQLGAASGLAVVAGCLGAVGLDRDGDGTLGDPTSEIEVAVTDMPNPSFEPALVHVKPGGTVRWNIEGRYHTVTSYHPDAYGPLRMPEDAEPFNSGILRQNQQFVWTFEQEGIYDYVDTRTLCATHEALGAVGRVVVGWPDTDGQPALEHDVNELHSRATTIMRDLNEETRAELA